MESLLALSFDSISSRDPAKIRKGLRQIESLLAQICLTGTPPPPPPPPTDEEELSPTRLKRRASAAPTPAVAAGNGHRRGKSMGVVGREDTGLAAPAPAATKTLSSLRLDPAFREFCRLQEGFQWNVTSRLLQTLETLMGMPPSPSAPTSSDPSPPQPNPNTNTLILSTLSLLHGLLLLHPPSRNLFTPPSTMTLLLDLLDPLPNPSAIQSQTLLVLVAALLNHPRNTRSFEATDGLHTVCSLLRCRGVVQDVRCRGVVQDVRCRALEVLYFYLLPEAPEEGDGGGGRWVRSPEEKEVALGRWLPNVRELVLDLQERSGEEWVGGALTA